MIMKNTSLTRIDLAIIEEIIANCGVVTDFGCVYHALAQEYSKQETKNKLGKLKKAGWVIPIKKGVYAISNIESHNFANVSPFIIAKVFVPDSYVSFEFALNHHGLFDQLSSKLTAVTSLKSRKYTFQNLEYKFVKTKPSLVFGFKEINMDGKTVKIAEIEKALIDFLHFRKDSYTVDLMLEKLREVKGSIDVKKLLRYLKKHPVTVQRRFGFLLDIVGIDASELHFQIKKLSGFTKLTKDSTLFNSKWRLYYEDRFIK